ncbi:MAG: crossover junction endodeoxyribonuclease RuvC [Gammaproteobacteria bacterium]
MGAPNYCVLGIDPGSRRTGWGVITAVGQQQPQAEAFGVIAPHPDQPMEQRLAQIASGISEVIQNHRVAAAAIEGVFVARNVSAALKLGQARGAILAALGQAELPCFEYAPTRIKQAIVGRGRAEKSQVGALVMRLLSLHQPAPEDAADALAVALSHWLIYSTQQRIEAASYKTC